MDKTMAGDASIEVHEKLGSFNLPECEGDSTGPQIRTSARVYKKMRLDASLSSEKKDSESKDEPDSSDVKSSESKSRSSDTKGGSKSDQVSSSTSSKPKLAPPSWSLEAKDTFFEALNLYGKDFESIQNAFAAKAREKNFPENFMKNKDQIRVFYFRTFYKLLNYLKFSDDVKRETQELYALINYGEFRKQCKVLSEKTRERLNHLVHRGHTHFRFRDRQIRVKTPQCPALRKLNRLDDWKMELQLPATVVVELRPRTVRDWSQVQSVAQNPRVRTVLPLEQRLASLLAYLEQRWRPLLLQHRDKLLSAVLLTKLQLEVRAGHAREPPPVLHVAPPPGVRIALPTFYCSEYLTSSSLSLAAYRERQAKREANLSNPLHIPSVSSRPRRRSYFEPVAKITPTVPETTNGKKASVLGRDAETIVAAAAAAAAKAAAGLPVPTDSAGAASSTDSNASSSTASSASSAPVSIESCLTTVPDSSAASAKLLAVSASAVTDKSVGIKTKPAVSLTSGTTTTGSSSSTAGETKPAVDGSGEAKGPEAAPGAEAAPPPRPDSKAKARAAQIRKERAAQIEAIRNGWSLENAQAITIGELYLMFGRDGKLQLEYWLEEKAPQGQTTLLTEGGEIGPVAKALQKLVSIAKLNYQKSKLLCPCGHVCGAPPKPKKKKAAKDSQENAPKPPPPPRPISNRMLLPTVQDGLFRRPVLAPSLIPGLARSSATELFKAQLEKIRPRFCNRRGRVRQKGVVVQRMLPLLPKVPNGHTMVAVKVIPPASNQRTGEFVPIEPKPEGYSLGGSMRLPRPPMPIRPGGAPRYGPPPPSLVSRLSRPRPPPDMKNVPQEPTAGPSKFEPPSPLQSSNDVVMSSADEHPVPSPPPLSSPAPSITNLLELDLGAGDDISLGGVSALSSGLLDAALGSSETPSASQTFSGLLSGQGSVQPPPCSSPADQQWLNSEVVDFSLSSLLGHLESPAKLPTSSATLSISAGGDETRLSDVDTQMQCLMSENSVDYSAKFADLAAQIAASAENKK